MNIVLTGPMGSGKTTVGMLAAEALDMGFADTDSIIERDCSIAELFQREGEEHFRELEANVVEKLSCEDNIVIATGGGVVLRPENMRRLRANGIIINLTVSPTILLGRLEGSVERPLLVGDRAETLGRLLAERVDHYSNCDRRIDTGSISAEEVAERVRHIAGLPVIRICACISGANAREDIYMAIRDGASMVELRLDLMPEPDIDGLIHDCGVPVIATDRKDPENLKKAILAGCDFVDVDISCVEKDAIIEMAKKNGCMTIVSVHDMEGVPDTVPEKGGADLLKIAATLNSTDDLKKLVDLHGRRDDVIIAAMGDLGGLLRVFGPMLGSYLTYCSIGEPTATGQLDLHTMVEIYRGMKLR